MRTFLAAAAIATLSVSGALWGLAAMTPDPPTPTVTAIGHKAAQAGVHIAVTADHVDAVPVPVPVAGTPSCWRPGCR